MTDNPEVDFIHKMASRMAAADPLHEVLSQIVDFAASVVSCDSCFLYALEDGELILRSSKNAHADVVDRLKLRLGQGITGWVAEHGKPVAVAVNASQDPRFQLFKDLPEDRFEAFLSVPVSCRGRVVGVINLQNREPHEYSEREIMLVSTIGFLVGAEIEMARLESENVHLSEKLETRKLVERLPHHPAAEPPAAQIDERSVRGHRVERGCKARPGGIEVCGASYFYVDGRRNL